MSRRFKLHLCCNVVQSTFSVLCEKTLQSKKQQTKTDELLTVNRKNGVLFNSIDRKQFNLFPKILVINREMDSVFERNIKLKR